MQHCYSCGADYDLNYRFCPICGKPLSPKERFVDRERVLSILQSLPGYKRIVRNCTVTDYDESAFFDFVLLHETGVFAFQVSESYRFLQGSDRQRFWQVEDIRKPGSVYMIERPVSTLEKSHRILDRALRKHRYARTFVYLLYPDNAGLETMVSTHLDQMLTLPRMRPILMRAMESHGHAHNKADIDNLYAIFTHSPAFGNGSTSSVASRKTRPSRHPKRARIIALIFLIVLLVLVGLYIHSGRDLSKLSSASFRNSHEKSMELMPKVRRSGGTVADIVIASIPSE